MKNINYLIIITVLITITNFAYAISIEGGFAISTTEGTLTGTREIYNQMIPVSTPPDPYINWTIDWTEFNLSTDSLEIINNMTH